MDELRRRYGAPRGGLSLANIVTVLSDSGIRVRAVTTPSAEALKTVMTPCILHWDDNHFVVLDHYAYGRFRIADPANGRHAYTPGRTRGPLFWRGADSATDKRRLRNHSHTASQRNRLHPDRVPPPEHARHRSEPAVLARRPGTDIDRARRHRLYGRPWVARRPKRFPAVGRDDAACLAAGLLCGRRVEHRDAHPRAGAIRTIPVPPIHDRRARSGVPVLREPFRW